MKLAVLLLLSACTALSAAKCRFRKIAEWSECDAATSLRTRTDSVRQDKSGTECPSTRTIAKSCAPSTCKYQRRRRAQWGDCDATTNVVTVTRKLVTGDNCPTELTERLSCRIPRPANPKNKQKNGNVAPANASATATATATTRKGQRKQERKEKRRLERLQRRQQRRQSRKNTN